MPTTGSTSGATPGLLWVASSLVSDRPHQLTATRFCDWYENQHIDEVVALSGVPAAARYEAVPILPPDLAPQDRPPWLLRAPWLSLYELSEVGFRNTDEFKALDGQSPPSPELLNEVFANARFETRFFEQIEVHESELGRQKKGEMI